MGYEEWIKSLKKTEENAAEISVWATSLNSHKKELEAKIITLQEQLEKSNEQIISLEKIIEDQKRNLFFRIADKLIKKSIKK